MRIDRVHLTQTPSDENQEFLENRLDLGIKLTYGPEIPTPAEYQILVDGRPTPEILAGSPFLSVLIIPWAGLSTMTRQLLQDYPAIRVHNLHHNAALAAEMALTLLLAVAKRLLPMDRALRSSDWRPRYQRSQTLLLAGKRALILGHGAIGQRLGQLLSALEMRVSAVRRQASAEGGDIAVHPPEALPELLPTTDVLMVTLPQTDATEGMIGAAELARLQHGAILVNVGRGPVVDQAALYKALKDGSLLGAGLDVWYNYPVDEEARLNTPLANFPFHELDNVVMSPHRAGGAAETERLRMLHLADALNAAARGDPIPNRVDLDKGY